MATEYSAIVKRARLAYKVCISHNIKLRNDSNYPPISQRKCTIVTYVLPYTKKLHIYLHQSILYYHIVVQAVRMHSYTLAPLRWLAESSRYNDRDSSLEKYILLI